MKFELEPYNRNTSVEEFIKDLQKVAKELNKETLKMIDYSSLGKFHTSTIVQKFGCWNKALEKADLKISKNMNIPIEELFKNI